MAVATCRSGASGINDPIVGIYDVRDPNCRAKDGHGGSFKGKYWPLPGLGGAASSSAIPKIWQSVSFACVFGSSQRLARVHSSVASPDGL
jgi:hypothetical protein